MCNLLLRAPDNVLWELICTDSGILQTSATNASLPFTSPRLVAPLNSTWALSTNLTGSVLTTKVSPSITSQAFFALASPSGFTWLLTVDTNGILSTTFSPVPLEEPIPTPIDVSMSRWPTSVGVTCPRCANVTVTVRGDFSCWCCSCQTFVDPDDTTILIVLSE